MTTVYIIQNQRNLYLSKDGLWLDKLDRTHLYRAVNRDDALNTLLEANAKDIELRLEIIEVQADAKGRPTFSSD